MKQLTLTVGVLACAAAGWAEPVLDESTLTVRQDDSRNLVMQYDLSGESAFVTLQAYTNGIPLPGTCVRTLSGDVAKLVETGRRTAYWNVRKDMPNVHLVAGELSVKLTAWSLRTPPPYLVIDLLKPQARFYYADLDALPYGHPTNSIMYKTEFLVMRRIPAAGVRYRRGAPSTEVGYIADGREDMRYVTLSEDFYMGIFEVTEGQVAAVHGTYWQSGHGVNQAAYPQASLPYNDFRGPWNDGNGYGWPEKGHAAGGVIAEFRVRTGLPGIDLPTSAQWEFACRAGVPGPINVVNASVNDVAWHSGNAGGRAHPVGEKLPNAYGLYDMLGNLEEWMLDVFFVDPPYVKDFETGGEYRDPIGLPSGSKYGSNRTTMGGSWSRPDSQSTSTFITSQDDWKSDPAMGFRLCCPIDPAAKGVPLVAADLAVTE